MRLYPLTSFPERFQPGLSVFLETPPHSGQGRWVQIQTVQPARGDMLVVGLSGVTSRDEAEALRSALLKVPRDERHPLPDHTFYVDDLIGLPVYTATGQLVGRVKEIHDGPAQDVMEIAAGGRRALVPMVRQFITIELAQGRVKVKPIPGMLDELLEGLAD